jgi:predicted glycosyltransferase
MDELRFIFYSHDGLGLGHIRRNLALAAALVEAAPDASVLVITGSEEVTRLGVAPNVDVVRLPGLRKLANENYAPRRLLDGDPDILALRSAQHAAAVEAFRPRVMVVDKHPLGACGELRRALGILKAAGGRAALGLRDVLDDPGTVRTEWSANGTRDAIDACYERLLVYGMPNVLDHVDAYGLSPAALRRVRHTGYVVHPQPELGSGIEEPPEFLLRRRTRPLVLGTAGGGQDGYELLKTFIACAAHAPWDAAVVVGPEAPEEDRRSLRRMAAASDVRYVTCTAHLTRAVGQVDALVCMGGYNSLVEAVSSGTPTVCVPRVKPRSEQLIRARAFARLGLIRLLEPRHLDAARLLGEVEEALRSSRSALAARASAVLDLDGARRGADCLLELARESESGTHPRRAHLLRHVRRPFLRHAA